MPTFLTLPPEIRNAIYADVFVLPVNDPIPTVPSIESPLAEGLQLDPRQHPPQSSPTASLSSSSGSSSESSESSTRSPSHETPRRHRPSHLPILLTCRQIHREVHLLALSTTTFHLHSTSAPPPPFAPIPEGPPHRVGLRAAARRDATPPPLRGVGLSG